MKKRNIFIIITSILLIFSCNKFLPNKNNETNNDSNSEIMKYTKNALETQDAFIQVHKLVNESIVNIRTKKTIITNHYNPLEELLFGLRNNRQIKKEAGSLGSGFVVSKEGYVVTNNHVINGADEIFVKFSNGKEYSSTLIGTAPEVDIAILKINSNETFKPLEFNNSDDIQIGQWAIAFGNPLGLNNSMTVGIVSASGRSSLGIEEIENFIQTDAAINRGNSGGPLLDISGKIIGVNTAIVSPNGGSIGLGFAIPSNLVKTVKESIISTGQFEKPYMGVHLSNLDSETIKQLDLSSTNGVLITKVAPNSPAHIAGIMPRDVILSIDKKTVTSGGALIGELAAKKIGQNVEFEIMRNKKIINISVVLGKFPKFN